eukprot:TRINITY_DN157_c0_g1_i1.p1 TRINITY_DN157_c0_g1~~TRINITY_DN157_c0_g1_i1.p1  ORF type:complete len:540 (+),score=89.10 TRINITY_DN157_c0_g1_i1:89-1708(+)
MAYHHAMLAVAFSMVVAGILAVDASCKEQSCRNQGTYLLQQRRDLHRNHFKSLTQESPPEEEDADLPDTITFDTIIRDFKESHPDFQSFDGHSEGLVESQLGPDKKPVYRGGLQLSNKDNFDQWYRDTPGINKRVNYSMVMQRSETGTYVLDSDNFFPIDGRGWGDSQIALDNKSHNFYFTLEMHTTFPYKGGEVFTFKGDDDVWVFINGNLVIDLGGVHNPMTKTVEMDSLNLTEGSSTELSFFFAERRCCGSKFRIETTIKPVAATCTIWGDPHIDVFDSGLFGAEKLPPVDIFSSGDYWLVKNQDVRIQGRYGTTQFTVDGQSALVGLAITGSFLQGHKLIIEPMDDGGKVTWDGEEILSNFPSEFLQKGFVRIKFKEGKKHIDKVLSGYPVKLLHAFMPNNVQIMVNRWPKHIDAVIRMPQQRGGQDGHCGNYNMNPDDDSRDQILSRMGSLTSDCDSIFKTKIPLPHPGHPNPPITRSLDDCDPETKSEAKKICEETGQVGNHLPACMFDVCFGGRDFAVQDALAEDNVGSSPE